MSLFSRKKKEREVFLFEEESRYITEEDRAETKPENPAMALTPEEIIGFSVDENAASTNALASLQRRMLDAQEEQKNTEHDDEPSVLLCNTEESSTAEEAAAECAVTGENPTTVPSAVLGGEIDGLSAASQQTEDRIVFTWPDEQPSAVVKAPDEMPEQKLQHPSWHEPQETSVRQEVQPSVQTPPESPARPPEKTLLEKCRPFILDENGQDHSVDAEPAYQLESVAEILKANSEETIQRLSRDYGIVFEDLSGNLSGVRESKEQTVKEAPPEQPEVPETPESEPPQSDGRVVLSDFESEPAGVPETPPEHTATIKFTPVTDVYSSSRISVSTHTKNIDLTGELAEFADESPKEENNLQLQETEFEEFVPEEEFTAESDSKHFLRLFSIKKRSSFCKAVLSVLLTVIMAIFELPLFSDLILSHTRPMMIVFTALFAAVALINLDMFRSLPQIVRRTSAADMAAVTATLVTLAYAVCGIVQSEMVLNMVLLASINLSFRALFRFFKDSTALMGFKQIASPAPKRAVKLIDDHAITFAMAKDSIEGDVLIAAPQRADHIDGYMKHMGFGTFLKGRMPVITIVSLLLSLIIGFAVGMYFDGALQGLYAAAVIQCLAAAPALFFIETLPLYAAAKKLNRVGAMIAGKTGAEQVAGANAMVLHADDLFPSGTVTLHQMKVLADNSIDDTLIRAASLTDAVGSPLASIFKKIAGTGGDVILPEADTVKYEEKMGVSGWVDDRLLFVGNRTLMEAHGIQVPSIEVDRKILRSGYFPIYVSTTDQACALFAVQYTVRPEIAHELRRISALGVTMLIHSTDPNLTEEMICDYMGLYSDSVKVMSNAGCHMYQNTVTHAKSVMAPAAYKGNPIGLAAIVSAANRIGRADLILTVLYALAAVLGTVLFTYISFDGNGSLVGSATVLLYQLACTVISYILYLIERP